MSLRNLNFIITIANKDKLSPWLLRFEFNRANMLDKQINMIDIYQAIYYKFNKIGESVDDIICSFSDDNSSKLVLRLRCLVSK